MKTVKKFVLESLALAGKLILGILLLNLAVAIAVFLYTMIFAILGL